MSRSQAAHEVDVLILGPLPPPFGGVSAHVERVRRLLLDEGMSVGVLNHFRSSDHAEAVLGSLNRNPLRYWLALWRHRSALVHYHHARWSTLLAVALAARFDRGRCYVMTIHGHDLRPFLESRAPLVATLTRWALSSFDEIVAVSEEIADSLDRIGSLGEVTVIPNFLEPGRPDSPLDDEVRDFLERCDPKLVVAAYRVTLLPDGEVYGLDLAFEALDRLARHYPSVGLCMFVAIPPKRRARRYLARLEEQAARRGHGDRLLVRYGAPLVPVFDQNVIFLRPSRTDGDAVSVREALAAGVPVVASDVVERPADTRTFESGDVAALCEAVEEALHSSREPIHVDEEPGSGSIALLAELRAVYDRHLGRCTAPTRGDM